MLKTLKQASQGLPTLGCARLNFRQGLGICDQTGIGYRERRRRSVLEMVGGLTGFEPMTSSMPWNETNIKILTANDLLVD